MTMANPKTIYENFLSKFKFVVAFEVYLTEFCDAVADIVLPDGSYLERLFPAAVMGIFNHPAGLGEWVWQIRQPVVKPLYERRDHMEVLLELADRLGIRDRFYKALQNAFTSQFGVKFPKRYSLDPAKRYTWEEICDRVLKSAFGPKRGLEWFKKNGFITWPKKVEEVYWRHFLDVRVPIYFEFFLDRREKAKKLAEELGMPDIIDWSRYTALPDWYPCQSHLEKSPEFDLYAIYYRHVLHTNSWTNQNTWLDELSHFDPYVYNIQINRDTAKKKGINDGDMIYVENVKGHKIKGRAKLVEGIHPEHIAIGGCGGHWTKGQPIALGKGVFFNELLEIGKEYMDPISFNQDICVKVKVYKA
jgi:molybdopterin-containing oxidoreductase family molybdopterin binding subunit